MNRILSSGVSIELCKCESLHHSIVYVSCGICKPVLYQELESRASSLPFIIHDLMV